MTEREMKETRMLEELAALGKIYLDCSEFAVESCHPHSYYYDNFKFASRYAYDKMLRLIRDYAKRGTDNDT